MPHGGFSALLGVNFHFKRMCIIYELANYFKVFLVKTVKASQYFVLFFVWWQYEQSVTRGENVRIRFWDNTAKQVCIWFFDSHFLKWSNPANLLNSLLLSVKGVIAEHMLQLAMDILNIYWNVLQLIYENYCEKEYSQVISIGMCGLHVLHSAFRRLKSVV